MDMNDYSAAADPDPDPQPSVVATKMDTTRNDIHTTRTSKVFPVIPASRNVKRVSSRKRRRDPFNQVPFFLTDRDSTLLQTSLSRHWTFQKDNNDQHEQHPQDEPDLPHFSQLLASLMLCTVLGLMSALDAKQQCLKTETYALLDLVDDDNFQKAYDTAVLNEDDNKCAHMFKYVLVPTGAATLVVGLLFLIILQRHWRRGNHQLLTASSTTPTKTWANFSVCVRLLICSLGILVAQTYNIIAVMLQPRNSGNTDNPYQSLAAVDHYGHVGDNANLYYLAWVSQVLTLALVYQLATVTGRLWRSTRAVAGGHALLPAMSWETRDFSESRAAWYQSIYKLRIRTGIWVAAMLTGLVVVASSQYVWNAVLVPYALQIDPTLVHTNSAFKVCTIVNTNSQAQKSLAPQMCLRTAAAWMSGLVAVVLCVTAIAVHLYARRGAAKVWHDVAEQGELFNVSPCITGAGSNTSQNKHSHVQAAFRYHRWALGAEVIFSMLLSVLLGVNAVFTTGVQGPAATVGNLYYASWFSFLLCVRICLGCLEELYDINDKGDHGVSSPPRAQASGGPGGPYQAPSCEDQQHQEASSAQQQQQQPQHQEREELSQDSLKVSQHGSQDSSEQTMTDPLERERAKRLRSYFFLGIFSTVCAASGYDAASNQSDELTQIQKYMMCAPLYVALQSVILFGLCLWSTRCYMVASHFCFGGLLSIFSFGLWVSDLVLTMHSEDSWAVNGIGEIKMANLYYFSWAAILTAGLQMMSYVKSFLRIKKTDYMSVVWIAICKVCFVILGASLHIWHTIADNCDFDELTSGAVTFCSRTVMAMTVALTGMLVGGLVVLGRLLVLLCPTCQCRRIQAHVEMLISMFLVLLFGATVALITGIGGPGQSVGDLYYSTWLAFFVSIGIFVSCYDQIKREDSVLEGPKNTEMENDGDGKIRDGVLV
jgi:hypothetical protein